MPSNTMFRSSFRPSLCSFSRGPWMFSARKSARYSSELPSTHSLMSASMKFTDYKWLHAYCIIQKQCLAIHRCQIPGRRLIWYLSCDIFHRFEGLKDEPLQLSRETSSPEYLMIMFFGQLVNISPLLLSRFQRQSTALAISNFKPP